MPTDRPRSGALFYEPALRSVTLSSPWNRLGWPTDQALSLTALAVLLSRYTQQTRLALDLLRWEPDARTLLRCELTGQQVVATLIERFARDLDGSSRFGSSHLSCAAQEAPARHLVSVTNRRTARSNVGVAFRPWPAETDGALCASALQGSYDGYDLVFFAPIDQTRSSIAVLYNRALFSQRSIERMLANLQALLATIALDRSLPIARLPGMGAEEAAAVAAAGYGGSTAPAVPVHLRFQAIAQAKPESAAVMFEQEHLTYGELEARSNRLARHLVALGVGLGVPVAVCMRPSLHLPVALLGVLKAGGVYLPIDPTHPEALIATMLAEARPRLVLTHRGLGQLTREFEQICLDTDAAELAHYPNEAPAQTANLNSPAYLLYTSGTTGKPKAVRASQHNLAHYVEAARGRFAFRSDDVFCSLARYTFSISMFELLVPLCSGASVRLAPRESVLDPRALVRLLESATVVHAGPSLLSSLFRFLRESPGLSQRFSNIRHASSGGDVVSPALMEQMKRVFDQAEIHVIYGCTEISCMGTSFRVERTERPTRAYVGKPFPGVVVQVLDRDHNPLPFHAVGEIAFSGEGVVPGYLARPELDAERFIQLDPRGSAHEENWAGRRFYLTGDLGRLHESGDIEILGRGDLQVQVRGIRVELSGIENTVLALGLAEQCAVVAKRLGDEDVRLVAFAAQAREKSTAAFRHALAAHLPDYMLPQHVVRLDTLPLTANGKLDRLRLQQMPWQITSDEPDAAAPQSELERQIAGLFASALGVEAEQVGLDQDFFDLGGHSLLSIALIQKLEQQLGFALPNGILFHCGTVRKLAQHMNQRSAVPQHPVLLSRSDRAPPLFVVAGVHVYRELAKQLEGEYSVYAVFTGCELTLLSPSEQTHHVTDLARAYVELIRRQQPAGPYRIAGTSFGGIVIYEVAQQLRRAGEEVVFVGMIDAVLPERGAAGWLARMQRLSRLPARELGPLVLERAREKVARALLRRRVAEFGKYQNDERFRYMEIARDEYQSRSACAYMREIRPYAGRVTLVIAGGRLRENPHKASDCGWQRHVPLLDLHVLDAGHMELLEAPRVREVAEIFRQAARRGAEAARQAG